MGIVPDFSESFLIHNAPTSPYIVHMRWYSDFRYWEDVPVRLDSQTIRATMAKLARLRGTGPRARLLDRSI